MRQPEALLFDLGGVLIDIDFRRALQVWQAHSRLTPDQIRQAFAFDEPYKRHEVGEIEASQYFQHLKDTLQLQCDHSVIAQGWNAIYVGEIAETVRLVGAIRSKIPCYAFTNTNASHMSGWTQMFPGVVSAFDHIFASHEIGLRKPEPQAFDYVARAIGVKPDAILFFDDLAENVEHAAASGYQSVLVRSPDDVKHALLGL